LAWLISFSFLTVKKHLLKRGICRQKNLCGALLLIGFVPHYQLKLKLIEGDT
jgi:hypothetical protein